MKILLQLTLVSTLGLWSHIEASIPSISKAIDREDLKEARLPEIWLKWTTESERLELFRRAQSQPSELLPSLDLGLMTAHQLAKIQLAKIDLDENESLSFEPQSIVRRSFGNVIGVFSTLPEGLSQGTYALFYTTQEYKSDKARLVVQLHRLQKTSLSELTDLRLSNQAKLGARSYTEELDELGMGFVFYRGLSTKIEEDQQLQLQFNKEIDLTDFEKHFELFRVRHFDGDDWSAERMYNHSSSLSLSDLPSRLVYRSSLNRYDRRNVYIFGSSVSRKLSPGWYLVKISKDLRSKDGSALGDNLIFAFQVRS